MTSDQDKPLRFRASITSLGLVCYGSSQDDARQKLASGIDLLLEVMGTRGLVNRLARMGAVEERQESDD